MENNKEYGDELFIYAMALMEEFSDKDVVDDTQEKTTESNGENAMNAGRKQDWH